MRLDPGEGIHILEAHGEKAYHRAILIEKEHGVPDGTIGARYGISFKKLERLATAAWGANTARSVQPREVKTLEPKAFEPQYGTLWSFRSRGKWATHDNSYRGNWSPYIPRNIILRYTEPGDTVLDFFSGGGTTAVEAKLLGRRCTALDVNPEAVNITRGNVNFEIPAGNGYPKIVHEPEVRIGNARDLSRISNNSVDLVCAHPPYAGIIKYSADVPGDLSDMTVEDFLSSMGDVARESLRVLRPGGACAILIGDARKNKHVVPIGLGTIRAFLDAGFRLKELIIKRQHNCRTTGFWYDRSLKYNFLLLAHEYLPVFEKPEQGVAEQQQPDTTEQPDIRVAVRNAPAADQDRYETTTAWIFQPENFESQLRRNLCNRFAGDSGQYLEISTGGSPRAEQAAPSMNRSLAVLRCPELRKAAHAMRHAAAAERAMQLAAAPESKCEYLAIEAVDVRCNGAVIPTVMHVLERLEKMPGFGIKEIVTLAGGTDPATAASSNGHLKIEHRYLLVFKRCE